MRRLTVFLVGTIATASAAAAPPARLPEAPELAIAEAFIDAFYSFDAGRLRAIMADAQGSIPDIGFYQGWAEGANYRVLERTPCHFEKPGQVRCPVTVKDDIVGVLKSFDVTDTFHLKFRDGRIVAVHTSSNDSPEWEEGMSWLRREHPAIFTGPCRGIWNGGPTPQDCARAIVKGFAEFRAPSADP